MKFFYMLVAIATLTGCDTKVQFVNDIFGATVQSIRWEPKGGQVYASTAPLLPGGISRTITVGEGDADKEGRVTFELLVEGNRVVLEAEESFRVKAGETNIYRVTAMTRAENGLAEGGENATGDEDPPTSD